MHPVSTIEHAADFMYAVAQVLIVLISLLGIVGLGFLVRRYSWLFVRQKPDTTAEPGTILWYKVYRVYDREAGFDCSKNSVEVCIYVPWDKRPKKPEEFFALMRLSVDDLHKVFAPNETLSMFYSELDQNTRERFRTFESLSYSDFDYLCHISDSRFSKLAELLGCEIESRSVVYYPDGKVHVSPYSLFLPPRSEQPVEQTSKALS